MEFVAHYRQWALGPEQVWKAHVQLCPRKRVTEGGKAFPPTTHRQESALGQRGLGVPQRWGALVPTKYLTGSAPPPPNWPSVFHVCAQFPAVHAITDFYMDVTWPNACLSQVTQNLRPKVINTSLLRSGLKHGFLREAFADSRQTQMLSAQRREGSSKVIILLHGNYCLHSSHSTLSPMERETMSFSSLGFQSM